jgi:Ribonuclease J C-terminal domain
VNTFLSAVQFLYLVTLEMLWGKESFPRVRRADKLPVVLSQKEVERFFGHVRCIKNRAALMLCYGAGLRISGIVLPIIAINRHSGRIESLPEIVSRGFAAGGDGSEFMQNARQIVAKTFEGSNQEEKTDWGVMKEKIRADLKRYISKETQRRPLIMPVILEV